MPSTRRLAAILFTDVVGFTAAAQADESSALARLREEEAIVRPLFAPFGGHEVKSTGDGALVEFGSALKATECAVEIQRRLHERNAKSPANPIQIRIGLHVGDVEEASGDIFGDAVNVASRIVAVAEPGGVCISGQVYDHVRNKLAYGLESLGPQRLKGLRDPITVHRVVLPWTVVESRKRSASAPRLAVLPLTSISSDPKDEYVADGLTEELISVLSQIRGLRVISRTSVNQFRGTTKSVAQIGSELGVASVVEGSVRRAGDQLRITLQLIDVDTDEHRWVRTYDRRLDNVFAIQAEVAEQTAAALQLELVPSVRDAIQRGPTSNLEAYELYLRGLSAQRKLFEDFSPVSEAETHRCYEGAIEKDPHFSLPYSQLANSMIATSGVTTSGRDSFPRVRQLVTRALELDPRSPEAHVARGNLALQADADWARAEAEFREGIEQNPSIAEAHGWFAILLTTLQRFPEALEQDRIFAELDPLLEPPRRWVFYNHHFSGASEAETEHANTSLRKFPNEAWPHISLGLAWANRGDPAEAMRELELARGATGFLGLLRTAILPRVGGASEVRRVLKEWNDARPAKYVPMTWLAALHSALGEKEAALDCLEQDMKEGEKSLWFDYQWDHFDPIRDDPRFVSMLRSLKLPTTIKRPRIPG